MANVFYVLLMLLIYALVIGLCVGSILFFAFMCRFIAKKKNRNPRGYFWLGFFTGWVGLLIIILLPKVDLQDDNNTHNDDNDVIDIN